MPDMVNKSASDIPTESWIDRRAPALIRPYLRLARVDRPIGTWLLLFPCLWGLALASEGWPNLQFAALFVIGSFVMRGAGCTVNDIADRNFDGQVARTAMRPIPNGDVSVFQAILFLGLQLAVGLLVLLQFNWFTVVLGASSLILVGIYPFMKRITNWPQLVLGLTFNCGALVGWAVVWGDVGYPAIFLYAACVFWTLGYDTIYAHQDKEDDSLIGLKSSALRLGDNTRPWLFGFYGVALLFIFCAGYLAELTWPFYTALIFVGGHLGWQALKVDIDNSQDCLAKFKSNRWVGWLLLAGLIAGQVAV
jgi:4-hydroxybenzoate polyprenyltransferase